MRTTSSSLSTIWSRTRSGLRSLNWIDATRVSQSHVGEKTFYAYLAQHRHELFRDDDYADLYRLDWGRPSVAPSLLCTALVLNELRHFRGYFRAAVYLPVILPPAVGILLWKYFYDPGTGLFNSVLRGVHLPTSQWIQSPRLAMVSLVLVSTWMNMGGAVILYLAGLKGIPSELYEAAEIDGASVWQRVRHVTLPSMRFLLLVLLLLQVIATMQVFTEPYLLTGTTDPSTITVMVLIYRYAFSVNQDIGLAAAMSMMLFLVLAVISGVYMWVTRAGGER